MLGNRPPDHILQYNNHILHDHRSLTYCFCCLSSRIGGRIKTCLGRIYNANDKRCKTRFFPCVIAFLYVTIKICSVSFQTLVFFYFFFFLLSLLLLCDLDQCSCRFCCCCWCFSAVDLLWSHNIVVWRTVWHH